MPLPPLMSSPSSTLAPWAPVLSVSVPKMVSPKLDPVAFSTFWTCATVTPRLKPKFAVTTP